MIDSLTRGRWLAAWLLLLTLLVGATLAIVTIQAYRAYNIAYSDRLSYSKTPDDYEGDVEWAAKIRDGGYILHFRHAEREKWNDVTAFDAMELQAGEDASKESYSRATCLTERGVEEARLIGRMFALNDVKVSGILTSPSCRSRQTSFHAFGEEGRIVNSLLHRTAIQKVQREDAAHALRAELDGIVVELGTNVVLSGHGGTLGKDGDIVIDDASAAPGLDSRSEGGFVVLEKVDGKIYARHVFKNFWQYVQVAVPLPVT